VIALDTHVWVWWIHNHPSLPDSAKKLIQQHEATGIGISAISLWEVAKLSQLGRLALPIPIAEWFTHALAYPGIVVVELTPQIVIESTQLPGGFHKDPADQLIVATARVLECELITQDARIKSYDGVQTP
jgi:PIN domain nuclease of toxin-antitoxin system